jgi:hypothetical protein
MRQKGKHFPFLFLCFLLAFPKNPHLTKKKLKKHSPTVGTDTNRGQVKKKTKKNDTSVMLVYIYTYGSYAIIFFEQQNK